MRSTRNALILAAACAALFLCVFHRASYIVTEGPAYAPVGVWDMFGYKGFAWSGTCQRGTGPKFYPSDHEIEFVCES